MPEFTIYHNPRCSKSRQALALLQEHGIEPTVVLYLQNPPTKKELTDLLGKLELSAKDIVRPKEPEYDLNQLSSSSTKTEIIAAIVKSPKLLERPIVVSDTRAVIGRPPENILTLINNN